MIADKIFTKIRELFIADSILAGIVGTRVYTSHISSITSPIYPAISLFLIGAKTNFACPEISSASIQIDIWIPSNNYNKDKVYDVVDRVRAVLNRQKITDSNVTFLQCIEHSVGPEMYESEKELYHLPMRYEVVAK